MRTRKNVTASILVLLAAGCSGSGDSASFSASDIRDQAPQGTMAGSEWTMAQAVVRVDSFDPDLLSVSLYPGEVDDCAVAPTVEGGEILFSVQRMEGEYPLSFDFSADSQTVTFSPAPGENIVASEGLIVVEALSDDEVSIGIVARSGDSSVNGRLTTSLCP